MYNINNTFLYNLRFKITIKALIKLSKCSPYDLSSCRHMMRLWSTCGHLFVPHGHLSLSFRHFHLSIAENTLKKLMLYGYLFKLKLGHLMFHYPKYFLYISFYLEKVHSNNLALLYILKYFWEAVASLV